METHVDSERLELQIIIQTLKNRILFLEEENSRLRAEIARSRNTIMANNRLTSGGEHVYMEANSVAQGGLRCSQLRGCPENLVCS